MAEKPPRCGEQPGARDKGASPHPRPVYRGISAAEKYAELESRGEERPKCECHGEPMYWHRDSRWGNERWDCRVNERANAAKRLRRPGAREAYNAYKRQRRQTPGTYEYDSIRGIGLPGARMRLRASRSYRKRADARDELLIAEIEARLGITKPNEEDAA